MKKTNNKSIAALTLGILSIIVPYIGLVLGIIGLVLSSKSIVEIDNLSENGRGLAISGKVCSIVGISLHALLILLMILSISVYYITEPSK
ncbi:DUF4190 domain-containing protein [Bacillus sp. ISL-46]|uniref:DUF4190 domain-containing protein n=1 Tax=Bacillus sp. ISL-46 TaxID=2819129 RepID=UPI001BED2D8F|nr:DUF4190 domain-containing protein [Bacillus sp. ISL-46]MBT2722864.1 DUF4190 domain-containing protein [Bacillus sp. ISL-46]